MKTSRIVQTTIITAAVTISGVSLLTGRSSAPSKTTTCWKTAFGLGYYHYRCIPESKVDSVASSEVVFRSREGRYQYKTPIGLTFPVYPHITRAGTIYLDHRK